MRELISTDVFFCWYYHNTAVMKFGLLVNSLQDQVAGISPDDLSRHIYILGGTGSGKSTLIRNLYKHLEHANYTGTLRNAAIYIDVKDEDAKLFLSQCDRTAFDKDNVAYLDINHTNFAVNLLELPPYQDSERDTIVSRMVGHVIEMFREFYSQPQIFVQMERILRLLLLYLYSNTDTPTMLDLYEIIIRLQKNGSAELQEILKVYKKVTGPEMKNALSSVSTLSKDSWTPLLNRLEMFATDSYLRNRFNVKRTTVDFHKMLVPGNITIFRISDTETPKYAHGLSIMAIVIKIWFMIQHRASKIESGKRTLVVLTLDEFQKIQDLSLLTSILSQSRSYNLGLILAHQNLSQIDTKLLETVIGNVTTQIYGRVSGLDASKIARIMDPHFTKELTDQITSQPDFIFTSRMKPPSGHQQGFPLQFKASSPPSLVLSESEFLAFIQKMKSRYSTSETIESSLNTRDEETKWMKQLYAEFRTQEEWAIIKFLYKQSGNLNKIVEGVRSIDRDKTSLLISELRTLGIVNISKTTKRGYLTIQEYTLSPEWRQAYFPESFRIIGTAAETNEVAKKAFEHYLEKEYFIGLANQEVAKKDRLMCDMVAYDYETDSAISIEIESTSEVKSHPEKVRHNMLKWKDLGFSACHVWSKSKKIYSIKERLGDEAKLVKVIIVES